jgi:2-polyprenyl-3-methyl-5-hydroxy-6-metoxy-1,4-benzoquinol methylase
MRSKKALQKDVTTADDNVRYDSNENSRVTFCGLAHESRYQWVKENFNLSDKEILDFGCGSGYGADILSDDAKTIQGVDYSKISVEYANKKYGSDSVKFSVFDVCSPDIVGVFGKKKFDLVISFDVIEHLDDYFAFLENIKKLLKKGGIAIIGCPNRLQRFKWNREWEEFHFQEFTPIQLKKVLNFYFSRVSLVAQDVGNREDKEKLIERSYGSNIKNMMRKIAQRLPKKIVMFLYRIKNIGNKKNKKSSYGNSLEKIKIKINASENELKEAFGLIAICNN